MYFYINRSDRSGSILQLMFCLISYCYKYKISYHGIIGNKNVWWYNQNFFKFVKDNFSFQNNMVDISRLKVINFNELKNYSNVPSNHLICEFMVPGFNTDYFDNNINYYFDKSFLDLIHSNLPIKTYKYINSAKKIISVHIRRGDVHSNVKMRYTSDNVYISIIDNIISNLENYEIHLFTEKNFNCDLNLFKKYKNIIFHIETESGFNKYENIFNDIMFMIDSDYLICSKSSFSYFPALINPSGNIYHNNKFWHKPLNKFLIYDDLTGNMIKN